MLHLFFTFVFVLNCANTFENNNQIAASNYLDFSFDAKNLKLRSLKNECDANEMKKIQKLLEDDICSPRLTMVELNDPDPNIIKIVPQNILLPRCVGGHSSKQHGCVPATTNSIDIPAILVSRNSVTGALETKCGHVKMDEHTTCQTGCKITSRDCNSKQVFHNATCHCECANQGEMKECAKAGKMWIEVTCSCECAPSSVVECSTGFSFDQHSCRCTLINRFHSTDNLREYISALIKKQKQIID